MAPKSKSIQPRIATTDIDPIARGILELFYDQCKRKAASEPLTSREEDFVDLIETAYHDQVTMDESETNFCLQEVHAILDEVAEPTTEQATILRALTQVIQPGLHRNPELDQWFEEVKKTILNAKRLDFSQPAPLLKTGNNEQNLATYAAISINTLLDTARYTLLSTNVLNAISEQLPDTLILVTDARGKLKAGNTLALEALHCNRYELAKHHLVDFLPRIDAEKLLHENDWHEVYLHLPDAHHTLTMASMRRIATTPVENEVPEHVFLLQQHRPMDLRLKNEVHITKLDYIIGSTQKLETKWGTEPLLDDLQQYAWELKEVLQGSLAAMAQQLPEGHEPTVPETAFRRVFDPLSKQFPYTELSITNEYTGTFFAVPADLELLAQLIADLCQLSKTSNMPPSGIHITLSEASSIGLMILCRVADVALERTDEKIFALLQQLVTNYRGFIHIFPMGDHKAAIQICLPHPSVHPS